MCITFEHQSSSCGLFSPECSFRGNFSLEIEILHCALARAFT